MVWIVFRECVAKLCYLCFVCPSSVHLSCVLKLSRQLQMLWVATCAIGALVMHYHFAWVYARRALVGDAVGLLLGLCPPAPSGHSAVPAGAAVALPLPASRGGYLAPLPYCGQDVLVGACAER